MGWWGLVYLKLNPSTCGSSLRYRVSMCMYMATSNLLHSSYSGKNDTEKHEHPRKLSRADSSEVLYQQRR
jgi:hypothetical protein